MKDIFRIIVMFIVGFSAYITIEVIYRGFSYLLMGAMGGIVFILIDRINEHYTWDTELPFQAIIGGIYATIAELIVGLIDVEYLGVGMWDYSEELYNFMGIVCPKFSLCWCGLALLAVFVADFVNYCIYRNSQRPYYLIFGKLWEPSIYSVLEDDKSTDHTKNDGQG